MQKVKTSYFEYTFDSFILPESEESVLEIIEKSNIVNQYNKIPLTHGLFDPSLTLKEKRDMLRHMIITIGYLQEKPVLFSYQFVFPKKVNDKFVMHYGLTMSFFNPGRNAPGFACNMGSYLFQKHVNDMVYVTTIVADPYFIGEFSRSHIDAFPSPYGDNRFPVEKVYKDIGLMCFQEYVLKYFPDKDYVSYDSKRYVISSTAQDTGFETNMRKMMRDTETMVNCFSMFWLDYDKQEVILQVGKSTVAMMEDRMAKFMAEK